MGLGLTRFAPEVIYVLAWICAIASIKHPKVGVFFLVPILPFQNVLYRLHDMPMGKDLVDILFVCVIVGWALNLQGERNVWFSNPLNKYAIGVIAVSGLSLIIGSLLWGLDTSLSMSNQRLLDWKNYIMLPILYFMVINLMRTKNDIRLLVALMLAGLFLADAHYLMSMRHKDMSTFHWSRKIAGILKTIGGNELAAFYAHFLFIPVGLFFYQKKLWIKAGLAGLAAITTYPILFLFSRGAYVAVFLGAAYIGVRRSKLVIIGIVLLVVMWNTLLPTAIVERIEMTSEGQGELDHSASSRFELWTMCFKQFLRNPIVGVGFKTFREFGGRDDPHNAYMETLAEQGGLGLLLMLALFGFTFLNGAWLTKNAKDPDFQGLGLAASAMVIAALSTNLFGDRWTYLQLGAWLWAMMALVARARRIEEEQAVEASAERSKAPVIVHPRAAAG